MPMLCIRKKNGTLCTEFDLQQQNENTWKGITPFPDQDAIHHDIAQAKFRSKLDMTEAYEQTCIKPEDVCKTTFSTIFSTFQSQVMQMGDCNAPSTFQQLMTAIFQEFLRRFVHVYLDNIFIYSQSIREHIEHIMKVLQQLKESQFYLSKSKLDLFSDKTDCLGHVIDDNGIHAKLDKMWWIREWRVPQNYNEVQKFLGLVQYLALYMPDIMAYTTPLSGSAQNNQTFQWTPLLDKCFQSIEAIVMWSPILKPVDFNKNEPVWVITNGSWTGISAMYGQGKDWDTCRPVGFLPKKFTSAQHRMHEQETLVVLEALIKWEDKLSGRKFTMVTDHKGLEYFKIQLNLSLRQARWWEYISCFNYDTIHVDGMWNQVADSLLCYYKYNTIEDEHPNSKFIKVDKLLDLDGDLAPVQQFVEIQNNTIRRSQRLQKKIPAAWLESQMINVSFNNAQ